MENLAALLTFLSSLSLGCGKKHQTNEVVMCTYGGDSHLDEGLAVDSILAMTFLYLFDTAYCYKKQLSETVNWYFESRISTFQEKHRGSVPLCVEICSFFKFCVQVSSSSVLRL